MCEHVVKHGTYGGYSNHGCRCELCTLANRTYKQNYYRRKTGSGPRKPTVERCPRSRGGVCPHDVPHGSYSTYANHGCRCRECRDAWNHYIRDLRIRRNRMMVDGETTVKHGVVGTYVHYLCRCRECKRAATAYRQLRREGGTGG